MIVTVPRTGSTSADLAEKVLSGALWPEGDWLVADRQDAGRGRLGRAWSDGEGNFMGSCLVRPTPHDPPASSLALLAGLAVYETLCPLTRAAALRPMLKWPNDVLLGPGKLAGILLENVAGAVIVGIGVNLANAPQLSDRATTSLADHGILIDRDTFAEQLATSFAQELSRWRTLGLAPMLRRWHSGAHCVGTRLRVLPPGKEVLEGTYAGLTEEGNLRLSLADGTVRTVIAGDVFVSAP